VVWRDRQGLKVYLDDYGLEGLLRPRAELDVGAEVTLRVDACDPREGTLRLVE